jgi:hypothetical protein
MDIAWQEPQNVEAKKQVLNWLLKSEPITGIAENEIELGSLDGEGFADKLYGYYKERDKLHIKRHGESVNITKSGIKTSRKKGLGGAKINAYAAVPDIIEKGRVIEKNMNWKDRGYDSYVIDAPIKIGTQDYIAEVIVNEYKNGDRNYYLHEVEERKKLLDATQNGFKSVTPKGASYLRALQLIRDVSLTTPLSPQSAEKSSAIFYQLAETQIEAEALEYGSAEAWYDHQQRVLSASNLFGAPSGG